MRFVQQKKSEDLYVNPEDLIVNIINTRTKLQNTQNDKSHRLSLSAFVHKELEKAARWKHRRKKERRREEKGGRRRRKKIGALRFLAQIFSFRVKILKCKCSNPILQKY